MQGDGLGRQFEHAVWHVRFDESEGQPGDRFGRIKDGEHWVVAPSFLSRVGLEGWQVTGITMHPHYDWSGTLLA